MCDQAGRCDQIQYGNNNLEGGQLRDVVWLLAPGVALVHLVAEVLEAARVRPDVEERGGHPPLPHLRPRPPQAENKGRNL